MAKKALGKGLGALIKPVANSKVAASDPQNSIKEVTISQIMPSALNPRKDFTTDEINELKRRHHIMIE